MATALHVLRTMAATGRELADLAAALTTYPQVLVNVRVRERVGIDTVPDDCPRHARGRDRVSTGTAGCWCATPAPSRCCASCSRAATRPRSRRGPTRSPPPSAPTWDRLRTADEAASPLPSPEPRDPSPRHGSPLRQRQQGRHAAQLAGRPRCPRWSTPSASCSTPAPAASPCTRGPTSGTSRRATSATWRRCWRPRRELGGVQHRGRPAARPAGAGARGATAPVHAGAGEGRRDHEPGRLAARHAARRRWRRAIGELQRGRRAGEPVRRPRPRAPWRWARDLGADRVEIYTEPFARAFERGPDAAAAGFAACAAAARAGSCASAWASTPVTTSTCQPAALPDAAAPRRGLNRPRADEPRALRGPAHRGARLPGRGRGRHGEPAGRGSRCWRRRSLAPAGAPRPTRPCNCGPRTGRPWRPPSIPRRGGPAPAVVLVHMLTRTRDDWRPFAERLQAAGATCLALDLRGHGGSCGIGGAVGGDGARRAGGRGVARRQERRPARGDRHRRCVLRGAPRPCWPPGSSAAVKAVAVLSPSADYRGVRLDAGLRKYGGAPAAAGGQHRGSVRAAHRRGPSPTTRRRAGNCGCRRSPPTGRSLLEPRSRGRDGAGGLAATDVVILIHAVHAAVPPCAPTPSPSPSPASCSASSSGGSSAASRARGRPPTAAAAPAAASTPRRGPAGAAAARRGAAQDARRRPPAASRPTRRRACSSATCISTPSATPTRSSGTRTRCGCSPKDANVSTDLGVAYYYTNQPDKAIQQFEQSLKIDPAHTKTMLNMGIVKAFGKQDLAGRQRRLAAGDRHRARQPGGPGRAQGPRGPPAGASRRRAVRETDVALRLLLLVVMALLVIRAVGRLFGGVAQGARGPRRPDAARAVGRRRSR